MLGGSHLIMLRCGRDAHFPKLYVQIRHKGADALTNHAEILILQLLPLRSGCAKQRSSGIDQVTAFQILFAVNNKVFLLCTDRRNDLFCFCIAEKAQNADGLLR